MRRFVSGFRQQVGFLGDSPLSPGPWHSFGWHSGCVVDGVEEQHFVCAMHALQLDRATSFEHSSLVRPTKPIHVYSMCLEVVAMLRPVHCNLQLENKGTNILVSIAVYFYQMKAILSVRRESTIYRFIYIEQNHENHFPKTQTINSA